VQVIIPDGLAAVAYQQGYETMVDSDIFETGITAPILLAVAEHREHIDTGLFESVCTARIKLMKDWVGVDASAQGAVEVAIYGDGNYLDSVTLTAADGWRNYFFYSCSISTITAQEITLSSDFEVAYYKGVAQDETGASIPVIVIENTYNPPPPQLGCISGMVWDDVNQNGIREDGEMPLAGYEVTLIAADGMEITSMLTLEDGSYSFCDLPQDT
jgi:hypothetical protein